MSTTAVDATIRSLMPPNHLGILAKRCKLNNVRYLQQVIALENTGYKHWPEILKLAKEANPEGYAEWAAANPSKLPQPQAA